MRRRPAWADRFGGEFVVAAAEVLHEREAGDDDRSGAVGAKHAQAVRFRQVVGCQLPIGPSRCLSRLWSASIRLYARLSTWCQAAGTWGSQLRMFMTDADSRLLADLSA
jgi:hypothetical protein